MGTVSKTSSMHPDSCPADLRKWKSVLDLPAPWLVQLLSTLDPNSLLALFRTCLAFRNLVLRWAPEGSGLTLQPAKWGVAQSVRALQLAHQHGGRAANKLKCWDWQQLDNPHTGLTTHVWAVLTKAHGMGIMGAVTSLHLWGVELEAPLPVQLSNLPNLSKFTLSSSTINWRDTTAHSFSWVPSKLHQLRLLHVVAEGSQDIWQRDLTQQLAQLTALRGLDVCVRDYDTDLCDGMVAGCMAAVRQLTRLTLQTAEAFTSTCPWSSASLASHFTALQDLTVTAAIHDQDMPGLLSFPRLQRLKVDEISLDQSWAGHHCTWRELTCGYYSTETLACLPLHANLLLKCEPNPSVLLVLDSTASIQAAITAVADAKLPRWRDVRVMCEGLRDDADGRAETNRRFVQALPLLSSAGKLRICQTGLSINRVCAYLDFRLAQQQALHLSLPYGCGGSAADLAELVSCMPAGSKLKLGYLKADEQLLTKLCCAIKHSIELHVGTTKLMHGYEERVQKAVLLQRHVRAKVTACSYDKQLVKVVCIV